MYKKLIKINININKLVLHRSLPCPPCSWRSATSPPPSDALSGQLQPPAVVGSRSAAGHPETLFCWWPWSDPEECHTIKERKNTLLLLEQSAAVQHRVHEHIRYTITTYWHYPVLWRWPQSSSRKSVPVAPTSHPSLCTAPVSQPPANQMYPN